MQTALLLLIVVAVGVALWYTMRRKQEIPAVSPKTGQDLSDAEPEVRAMLALREQLATEGLDPEIRGEVDELFARVARVGIEAMGAPTTNRASLRSMRELLTGTQRNGWTAATVRTTRVGMEELALMIERGENGPPARFNQEWSAWAEQLPRLPDLRIKTDTNPEALLALVPGDYLLVAGQLCTVGPAGISRYTETYQGDRWEWHEVPLVRWSDGQTFGIDWEIDDGLEISLAESEYTLAEMNLSPVRVRELIEEEEGSVTFGGDRYEVNESGTAHHHRGGKSEEFDYVELSGPAGRSLTLEDWGDELSGFLSRDLPLREVKILAPR